MWWYCTLSKNMRGASVTYVDVCFRYIAPDGSLGSFVFEHLAISFLGHLRLGTVWRDSHLTGALRLQRLSTQVNFCPDGWSLHLLHDKEFQPKLQQQIAAHHRLPDNPRYDNWVLKFSLPDGAHLLVPCVEFLSRAYARSAEVVKCLTTYQWSEFQQLMYRPITELGPEGSWSVKLAARAYNSDVVFLAHAMHDPYANETAMGIYAGLETQYLNGIREAKLKVKPWYEGPATLIVEGVHMGAGDFLALRIIGCSHPQGATISRDREGSTKTRDSGNDLKQTTSRWKQSSDFTGYPDIANLTDFEDADSRSGSREFQQFPFEIPGPRRHVIDVYHERKTRTLSNKKADSLSASLYSVGEQVGFRPEVARASLHAPVRLDSEGALRDTWNALHHLQARLPSMIAEISWMKPDGTFCSLGEAQLVNILSAGASAIARTPAWAFLDKQKTQRRAMLVVRMVVRERVIYLCEIQRRIRASAAHATAPAEESFCGLVFTENPPFDATSFFPKLLSWVLEHHGIFARFLHLCPPGSHNFPHPTRKSAKLPPGMPAVDIAFAKVGCGLTKQDLLSLEQ